MAPRLVPEFAVADCARSKAFYCDVLGFSLAYEREEDGFAYLDRDGAEIMLDQIGRGRDFGGDLSVGALGRGVNLQIEVESIAPLLTALAEAGHNIAIGPEDKWYRTGAFDFGNRQFVVADPDGYLLRFFEPLGSRPHVDQDL